MARYRFAFVKNHCIETTSGPGDDEIYFAAFPSLARSKEGGGFEKQPLKGVLSTVQNDVNDEMGPYVPMLTNGKNYVDVDVPDSGASAICMAIYMYEEDDGEFYGQLRSDARLGHGEVASPGGEWTDLMKDGVGAFPTSWVDAIVWALGWVVRLVLWAKRDDFISSHVLSVDLTKPSALGYREFTFRGDGGEYKLGIQITKL